MSDETNKNRKSISVRRGRVINPTSGAKKNNRRRIPEAITKNHKIRMESEGWHNVWVEIKASFDEFAKDMLEPREFIKDIAEKMGNQTLFVETETPSANMESINDSIEYINAGRKENQKVWKEINRLKKQTQKLILEMQS